MPYLSIEIRKKNDNGNARLKDWCIHTDTQTKATIQPTNQPVANREQQRKKKQKHNTKTSSNRLILSVIQIFWLCVRCAHTMIVSFIVFYWFSFVL